MKKEVEKESSAVGKVFSTIFLILSISIGLISILTAITGFFTGFILSGILYLILGIFTFLPRKIIKIPNWTKFLITLTAFIILLIINISLNWSLSNELINHNMQETFILDGGASNISMIIYNTSKEKTILLNSQEKTTEGYFLFVNGKLTNLGSSAVNVNPTYDIIDNQNKSYAGMGFSGYQEAFQPDLEKDIYFLFELPTSAQELKFRIKDRIGIHVIDLGM